jgi:Fic family protein
MNAETSVIKYQQPKDWIQYDIQSTGITADLTEAKAMVLSLKKVPYQKDWFDKMQVMELKREVAGTSRIEGAVFTERELEAAMKETPAQLHTRSQREAYAAVQTYRWIESIPSDRPIDKELILEIHGRLITGADDDICPPAKLRKRGENVTFGAPRHRGVEGGDECEGIFDKFIQAINGEYREHDPLVQSLAAHYHLAAMHPFLDGNGRTARALSALMLQRAGLKGVCFISLSNYYYDNKTEYLNSLNSTRQNNHNLTVFLKFGLQGITSQSSRLLEEMQQHVSKALFLNIMYELVNRLQSPRKAALAKRQMKMLQFLLEVSPISIERLIEKAYYLYASLKKPSKALIRDLIGLRELGAVKFYKEGDINMAKVRLEWPTEITESDLFSKMKKMPHLKSLSFLHPEISDGNEAISV